jgi:hypothetical protein
VHYKQSSAQQKQNKGKTPKYSKPKEKYILTGAK